MEVQQQSMLVVDPLTTAWLKSSVDGVFGYPALVRFSWQTTTRMLEDTACAVHWYDHCSIIWHGHFHHCVHASCNFDSTYKCVNASIDADAMPQVRTASRERPHKKWHVSHRTRLAGCHHPKHTPIIGVCSAYHNNCDMQNIASCVHAFTAWEVASVTLACLLQGT